MEYAESALTQQKKLINEQIKKLDDFMGSSGKKLDSFDEAVLK